MRIGSRWFINRASEIIIEELNHSYSLLFFASLQLLHTNTAQLKLQVSFNLLSSIQISFWWLVDWLTDWLASLIYFQYSIFLLLSLRRQRHVKCIWRYSFILKSKSDIFIHIFSQNTYSFMYIYSPQNKTSFIKIPSLWGNNNSNKK